MTKHPTPPLLPIVPANLADLDSAIMLLGNRAGSQLRGKARRRLVELVGKYPNMSTALAWKAELKVLRRDEIFSEEIAALKTLLKHSSKHRPVTNCP